MARVIKFALGETKKSGLRAVCIQPFSDAEKERANPPNATTIANANASADTVAAVRRGACTSASAARAPSAGKNLFRIGRSPFAIVRGKPGVSNLPVVRVWT